MSGDYCPHAPGLWPLGEGVLATGTGQSAYALSKSPR